jgi:hypothetical protein
MEPLMSPLLLLAAALAFPVACLAVMLVMAYLEDTLVAAVVAPSNDAPQTVRALPLRNGSAEAAPLRAAS